MKIWITQPFDDDGIREIDTIGEPTDACILWRHRNGCLNRANNWYREGYSWHRTEEAALKAALQHRANRIENAAAEIARVAALPPVSIAA